MAVVQVVVSSGPTTAVFALVIVVTLMMGPVFIYSFKKFQKLLDLRVTGFRLKVWV